MYNVELYHAALQTSNTIPAVITFILDALFIMSSSWTMSWMFWPLCHDYISLVGIYKLVLLNVERNFIPIVMVSKGLRIQCKLCHFKFNTWPVNPRQKSVYILWRVVRDMSSDVWMYSDFITDWLPTDSHRQGKITSFWGKPNTLSGRMDNNMSPPTSLCN